MATIEDIPPAVLNKIKEYAFLQYGVTTVTQLKAKIVDERFNEIINDYLGEVMLRILRAKADEAKAYDPTEAEIIAKLQAKIDAASHAEE
jgi:hypothetical protein